MQRRWRSKNSLSLGLRSLKLLFQAPLVCQVAGRWYVSGLVSWGIGCASEVPGVYINVFKYIPWIQNITMTP
jgi:Trypsin